VKYNKALCLLALAMSLSLVVTAFSPSPAHADYGHITTRPHNAEVGDKIFIYGSDFTRSITIHIYFSSDYARLDDEINDKVTIYEQMKSTCSDKEDRF